MWGEGGFCGKEGGFRRGVGVTHQLGCSPGLNNFCSGPVRDAVGGGGSAGWENGGGARSAFWSLLSITIISSVILCCLFIRARITKGAAEVCSGGTMTKHQTEAVTCGEMSRHHFAGT